AFGRTDQVTWQIEAFGAGIDFEKYAAFSSFRGDALKVERIGFAVEQDSAREMTQDFQRRRFERAQKAIGHFSRLEIHVTMDATDHEVKLGQRLFGDIHRAIAQDVTFQAGKHSQWKTVAVEFANLLGEGDN